MRNGTSGSRLASTKGALPRPTVRLGRSRIISLFKKLELKLKICLVRVEREVPQGNQVNNERYSLFVFVSRCPRQLRGGCFKFVSEGPH